MKQLTLLLFAIPFFLQSYNAPKVSSKTKASGKWVKLFNGKNLNGWSPKITGHKLGDNYGNTFRVENGMLQVRYDEYIISTTLLVHCTIPRNFPITV